MKARPPGACGGGYFYSDFNMGGKSIAPELMAKSITDAESDQIANCPPAQTIFAGAFRPESAKSHPAFLIVCAFSNFVCGRVPV